MIRYRIAVPVAVAVVAGSVTAVWVSDEEPRSAPIVSASSAPALSPSPGVYPAPGVSSTSQPTPPATDQLGRDFSPAPDFQPHAGQPRSRMSSRSPLAPRATAPTRPPAPARPRPSSSPASSIPAPPAPDRASLDDLLTHDGPPPDGVADQLNLFLGGGPECHEGDSTATPRVDVRPVVEIPSFPTLCVDGFDSGRDLTVTVTGPAPARTLRTGWDSLMGVRWPVPSGSPTGRYRVRVAQGSRTATATFTAVRATLPRLWLEPRNPDAGATVDIHIGGFPADRPADLHLYATQLLVYRATTTIRVDRNGEGHLALRTSRSGPFDAYAVNSPLVYVPPPDFEPGELGGPENSVFWLHDP
ncbi:hypothetical protein AB0F72_22055 [Actinoplanes sp. NPDC023936]|uniref:hypothetical protein n=1 Tax=Actinoplanes sp. NPDC023936 TaxID=3154910 RepID=UPI0033EF4BC0